MGHTSFWSILVILIYWVTHRCHNQEHTSFLLNSSTEVGKGEKSKLVSVVTMKTYMGSRGTTPRILDLTTRWN